MTFNTHAIPSIPFRLSGCGHTCGPRALHRALSVAAADAGPSSAAPKIKKMFPLHWSAMVSHSICVGMHVGATISPTAAGGRHANEMHRERQIVYTTLNRSKTMGQLFAGAAKSVSRPPATSAPKTRKRSNANRPHSFAALFR